MVLGGAFTSPFTSQEMPDNLKEGSQNWSAVAKHFLPRSPPTEWNN